MDTTLEIGKLNRQERTVTITLDHAGHRLSRQVNACYAANGRYDAKATKQRCEAVARGLRHKIERGHFAHLQAPAID